MGQTTGNVPHTTAAQMVAVVEAMFVRPICSLTSHTSITLIEPEMCLSTRARRIRTFL
jgi:hypothetical protein